QRQRYNTVGVKGFLYLLNSEHRSLPGVLCNSVILSVDHHANFTLVGLPAHAAERAVEFAQSGAGQPLLRDVGENDDGLLFQEDPSPLVIAPHAPAARVGGRASEQAAERRQDFVYPEVLVDRIPVPILAWDKDYEQRSADRKAGTENLLRIDGRIGHGITL